MATNQAPQIENETSAQVIARFAKMPSKDLPLYTNDLRYGALALAEISRRNRINIMDEAAKAQGVDGGKISDQQIAQLMQNQMREKLGTDDRMGMNNIVAAAEQGAINFGQQAPEMQAEPVSAAGGGIIAFDKGGPVQYDDGSQGYLAGGVLAAAARAGLPLIQHLRGIGPAARSLSPTQKAVAGTALSTAASAPFMFGDDEPPVSDVYPEEFERGTAKGITADREASEKPTKSEKKAASGIAKSLGGGASAEEILAQKRELEKKMGVGEYGGRAKEILEKRRQRAAEVGEAEYIEKLQEGISRLGGKRRTDVIGMLGEGLGAIAGATGAEKKARMSAEDAADELDQKIALAEDLYKRGEVDSAMKLAREIEKDRADAAYKQSYLSYLQKASAAKASGGKGLSGAASIIKQLEIDRASALNQLAQANDSGDKRAIAMAQNALAAIDKRINSYVALGMGNLEIGTRDRDEESGAE